MVTITGEIERGADVARMVVNAVLAPWGGTERCIDAYETSVRLASDLHLTAALTLHLEPARSLAATLANLTRDIGATQVSTARWFLDA
jgi:hypothetical protein